MTRLAFICTGNSCRSQMAEGWARSLCGGSLEVWSAGVAPLGVNPRAIAVMMEVGVDISGHRSKKIEAIPRPIDFVVTVCGHADQNCPNLAATQERLHWDIQDPQQTGDEQAILADFRRARDEIRRRVEAFLAEKGFGKR